MSDQRLQPVVLPRAFRRRLGDTHGNGIRVGVIDSGFTREFAGAGPRTAPGLDLTTDLQREQSHIGGDTHGHGTKCVLIAYRVAPAATYVPIRIFDRHLSSPIERICEALRWAATNNIQVVNLSLRCGATVATAALYEACAIAARASVTVIAASASGDTPSFPAWFDNTIAVDAGGTGGKLRLEYRSDGPVELATYGAIDGQIVFRGTTIVCENAPSYAAPVVSGIVAHIRERYPRATLPEIRELLRTLADRRR
jgi:subtilisin family serine protease